MPLLFASPRPFFPRPAQLIVITHDEEFVSELGRATQGGGGPSSKQQIGVYYRVSREEVRPGVFHSFLERLEDLEF